jgi:undecaprenyl-diphosphatase
VTLAQAVGTHALPSFLTLLALLLLAVAALGRSLRRLADRHQRAAAHPFAALTWRLALGFALILAAAFVFTVIAGEIAAGQRLASIDQAFSDAVASSTPPAALQAFGWITHLGDPLSLLVLCLAGTTALLARAERLLAFGLVCAIGGNALLNPALKRMFERLRPLHDVAGSSFDGFSFPSGHSSGALVAYGMLAYVLLYMLPRRWHLPALMLAAAVAFSVGCSRVFLQAHFASDVLAGFASGSAWLGICIVSLEWVRHGRRQEGAVS